MDKIVKAVILDKKARVTIIDSTEAVTESIKMHDLTPLAAAALGRALTAGAYISSNLKKGKFNLRISGGGPIGNIEIAGADGNYIRGFVSNPHVDLPLKANGKLDVGGAVGTDGFITVIKDLGLKEPYVGSVPLVSGEIAEDFASYLLKSEGILNAVSLGVRLTSDKVISGGLILEVLPGMREEELFILEDIISQFSEISLMMTERSVDEILDFYFGHLDCEILGEEPLTLKCNCSKEKIDSIIKGLSMQEIDEILKERDDIEVRCDFCSSVYSYSREDAKKLKGEKND